MTGCHANHGDMGTVRLTRDMGTVRLTGDKGTVRVTGCHANQKKKSRRPA